LHRNTNRRQNGLWIIRESYLSLLVDIAMKEKPLEALQKLEDMTFSDAEIDAFLPKELKRLQPPA
jgi:hypothetical protein